MFDAKQICQYPPERDGLGSVASFWGVRRSRRRGVGGYKEDHAQLGTPIQTSLNGLLL